MKRAAFTVLLLVLASVARAQPAQQTPLEQALFQRLGAEVQANIEASAKIIGLQQQLTTAQETIKRLTPKPPESAPAAKQ